MVNIELVRFKQVYFAYPHAFNIFKYIDFTLYYKDFYFLTGRSGVGKTTFLRLIYGDIPAQSGIVSVFGTDIKSLDRSSLGTMRQNIGIVFQEGRLFDHLTVLDNVALALHLTGQSVKKSRYVAYDFLSWVGLCGQEHKFPRELSDGQRQRVAIARAVITKPLIVVADEPTGNLDFDNALKIMQLFVELHKKGTTIIFITHHNELLSEFREYKQITLDNGLLIEHKDMCKRYAS